jgi:hypothetical protein
MTLSEYKQLSHDERCRRFYGLLGEARRFDCLDFHMERDDIYAEVTGECELMVDVTVEIGRTQVRMKGDDIFETLVSAIHEVETRDHEEYKKQQAKKAAALAKLSEDERQRT